MKITFVKKIKADGSPCKKCADVERRLIDNNQIDLIDEIVVADERDNDSAGMLLARAHKVEQAPFFLVDDGQKIIVYTVYFQLVKEVLKPRTLEKNLTP
ncbi:MAG: hypothetical protein GKR93_09435 [Gammaproteobacteria bacterium]|nr:hypothetical protein [Gammaproteobacteria bacterium]